MRLLYSLAIECYSLGIRIAAIFGHTKARQMVEGWRQWSNRLSQLGNQPAWFHAASLGEFEQARPVIEAYRRQHPHQPILLTFFSPSGYEVRHAYPMADAVCYLPIDTPRNARRFVRTVKPKIAFFVKYDFWFNYLDQLRRSATPTYLFSAIFRPKQYFFKPWGRWFCKQLSVCYSHIFVQNEESRQLLQTHGVEHCSIATDTRFDRVSQIARDAQPNAVVERWIEAFADGDKQQSPILIAGSSWPPDEQLLARLYDESAVPFRLIIAPHVVSPEHIAQIERLFSHSIRYSQLASNEFTPTAEHRTLIIDNVGMLSQLYRYANVAYIGGGFGVGIHNILEAITFGLPVVFGPNYAKFQEAHDVITLGGGWSIDTYDDLQRLLNPLLADPTRLAAPSKICLDYVSHNTGGTDKILHTIEA